jgi:hypothetical protein
LFKFLLPRKICDESFEPDYNDLLEDYLLVRRYRSSWARRWLKLCFVVRAISIIVACLWVLCGSKLRSLAMMLVPESVRAFFRNLKT